MLTDDIKAALPLADEFLRSGQELRTVGSRLVCFCPFHRERTPSCYITPATGRWKCFGCGAGGSVIDFYALKHGITPTDAIAALALRLRISPAADQSNHNHQSTKPKVSDVPRRPRVLPKLPDLHQGTARALEHLAERRRLSVEALRLASRRGLLWFCRLKDGAEAVDALVITDRTRRNAQARRLDGERWHHAWDADAKQWALVEPERRRKVRGFTGNQASWPVGIEEAERFGSVAILEGIDLLAAFHFLIAEAQENAVAPVAILGAGNRIPDGVLKLFTGKRVRIFPHSDANHSGAKTRKTTLTCTSPAPGNSAEPV